MSKIWTSSDESKFEPQENLRCKNCTSNCDDARYTPVALKFCILLPTPEKVVL